MTVGNSINKQFPLDGASGGTGVANTSKTITLGGNLTTSGANNVTFTTTGSTSLTLPTSGTLATTAGSGAITFLTSATASSSATLDFTTNLTSTYDAYLFVLAGLIPQTNAQDLWIRISTDGGGTWKSGGTDYRYMSLLLGYATGGTNSLAAAQLQVNATGAGTTNISNAAGNTINGCIYLFNPAVATFPAFSMNLCFVDSAAGYEVTSVGSGAYNTAAAINGVRFLMSSGNITSGVIRLYGIKNS